MLRARLAPLALATVAAAGCAEDPSFAVRWRLQPLDQVEVSEAAELVSVDQCTELGISRIRVSTRDGGNALLDEREFPCFPAGSETLTPARRGPRSAPARTASPSPRSAGATSSSAPTSPPASSTPTAARSTPPARRCSPRPLRTS
ncbi:hypothetical protein OV079_05260 [Nannocystis pusilla]|uniref:Uncharacterized protein n=1 Tax=Nannocystis pusilla TaxID=889268 RepID=A0A9X3EKQ2_9BACT|nr:hypothetical protein [Nannocystis pusilla]MCY1004989.1 hypothetical protein [Nannocystis pusilla]